MTLESFVGAFWCLMLLPVAFMAWVGLARWMLWTLGGNHRTTGRPG